MPLLEFHAITKCFGPVVAVDALSLTIPSGEFVALLGPSGCGKTTTLRMLAGLEFPDAGEIRMDGRVLSSSRTGQFVPPERRGVGLVFQSYALWPHLRVSENLAFGPQMRGWPRDRQRRRVQELLDLLQIGGLGDRYPSQLSGGQQQRVALARSLAVEPEVLLLDEPLSNLDAQLRLEMRAELKRLHAHLTNTIVYVTHDQAEAMTMATLVVVMRDGHIQQFGPPLETYRRPANVFVAKFVGSPTMTLFAIDDPLGGPVARSVLSHLARMGAATEPAGTIGIRPEAFGLVRSGQPMPSERWSHHATVETILPTGAEWLARLRVGEATAFARTVEEPSFLPLEAITVTVARSDLHLFDPDGRRLPDIAVPGIARESASA